MLSYVSWNRCPTTSCKRHISDNLSKTPTVFSAVSPPGLQIILLRIDREGVIEQNTRWLQLSWICDVLPDWFTSHQSYYWVYCKGIIYHTGVYEETFDVNCEIQNVAQTMQNIEKFTSVIIREISYSNLETREIRSKLWSPPDYPGDLTTLSFTFFFFQDLSWDLSRDYENHY